MSTAKPKKKSPKKNPVFSPYSAGANSSLLLFPIIVPTHSHFSPNSIRTITLYKARRCRKTHSIACLLSQSCSLS